MQSVADRLQRAIARYEPAKHRPGVRCKASLGGDLPSHVQLKFSSKQDASFLVNEIYQEDAYLRHGVTLQAGDVVIDVGANVGLFSLQAADRTGSKGQVFCLEPGPAAYNALLTNIQSYSAYLESKGEEPAQVFPINVAAGRCDQDTAHLTVYRDSHGWSTTSPDKQEVQEGMRSFLNNALVDMSGIKDGWLPRAAQLLRRIAPKPIYEAVWRLYVGNMLRHSHAVECEVYALSDIISDHDLDPVDLLKIDVERAELDVLAGLDKRDWPKIRQIVMEVHDIQGRLDVVQHLLEESGVFTSIVTEQSRLLQGSNLYTLYAVQQTGLL